MSVIHFTLLRSVGFAHKTHVVVPYQQEIWKSKQRQISLYFDPIIIQLKSTFLYKSTLKSNHLDSNLMRFLSKTQNQDQSFRIKCPDESPGRDLSAWLPQGPDVNNPQLDRMINVLLPCKRKGTFINRTKKDHSFIKLSPLSFSSKDQKSKISESESSINSGICLGHLVFFSTN